MKKEEYQGGKEKESILVIIFKTVLKNLKRMAKLKVEMQRQYN